MKFQIDFKLPVHLQQTCHFRFETSKEKNQKKNLTMIFLLGAKFFFSKILNTILERFYLSR